MTTPTRTDSELTDDVVQELSFTSGVDSTRISVSVNDGAVTLAGEVGSYPERLLACTVASRIRGVVGIAQEMTVRNSWTALSDADVASRAGEGLQGVVDVPDTVTVTVRDHVVTLSGQVAADFQRRAAQHVVEHLVGVRGVLNFTDVRPTVGAEEISASIRASLLRTAQYDTGQVTVRADSDGVVTLDGEVRSWAERSDAETSSWAAPGVTGLVNQLRVLPAGHDL